MNIHKQYAKLVYEIIGAAMTVHRELNWGLLEPVYQEALSVELISRRITNNREESIDVFYKKQKLDKQYKMDIVVNNDIIVELKSVSHIIPAHRAQLCNYLRLTRKPIGRLINFGEEDLICERWALDSSSNKCFVVDKEMNPVYDVDYNKLFETNVANEHLIELLMSD